MEGGANRWAHHVPLPDTLDDVYGWGPSQLYPPNTEIYHQDTPANAVYLIERGLVKLTWVEPDGHEVIVGLRRRHWLLGAPAVLLKRRFAFTVTTLTPCSLRCIPSKGFLHLMNADAEFCRQLLRRFSEEIYSHGMSVAVLGCMPARDRLKRFLCELVLEQGRFLEVEDVRKYLKDYRMPEEERHLPVPLAGRSVEQAERELIFRALLDTKSNLMELRNLLLSRQGQEPPAERPVRDPAGARTLSLQDMEQRMIAEALERYKGNRRVAARALNISERTLYRKIKEFGLG